MKCHSPSDTRTRRHDLIVLAWLCGIWVVLLLISEILFVVDASIDLHAMTVFMVLGLMLFEGAFFLSLFLLAFLIRFAVRHPKWFWISLAIGFALFWIFGFYCWGAVTVTGL